MQGSPPLDYSISENIEIHGSGDEMPIHRFESGFNHYKRNEI